MTTSFADLGVPTDMCASLERNGITSPFDIQSATIRDALAGRDVLGRAPTGSGKTLAFGIPMLANLTKAKPRRPRGLILSPTRELAEQIRRELAPLAQVRNLTILSIYGGVGFRDQLNGLKNGADLLVACPGRLIDLLGQGQLRLDDVDHVVVDEADRMADMGFLPAVKEILDLTNKQRQTVLFSATLDREVKVLTDRYQNDPVTHEVGETEPDLSLVTHRFIKTLAPEKLALAADLIDDAGPTVIFCRTRHGVDRVARQLKSAGVKSGWIHGGRSQNQRDAALQAFIHGKVQALVATDVAARGIHVDGVACVIHFDPPTEHKDYVHRSGRTARAGAGGSVVSFINRDQEKSAKKMMKDVGLPPVAFEETPPLTERAKHVKVDVRPKRANSGRPQNRSKSDRPDRARSNGSGERRAARSEQPTRSDRPERTERTERSDSADRSSRPARSERGRPGSGRSERPERSNRSERTDSSERPARSDRSDRGTRSGDGARSSGPRSNGAGRSGTGSGNRVRAAAGKGAADKGKATDKPKRSGKPRPKNKPQGKNGSRR